MGKRNKRPDLNGVLNTEKPHTWSSAKAVAHVRRLTGGAKVGHAGTLDPLATGVLVLCLGRATKYIHLIQAAPKAYTATINLEHFTTTDDAEGEPIAPDQLDPADFLPTPAPHTPTSSPPTEADIRAALDTHLTGDVTQRPPDFSAVKVNGQRAYKLARAGDTEAITIKPKTVRIDRTDILAYTWPELTIHVDCGKGTYIRSIARDLGLLLGTGGHLTALRRTAVGDYTESTAHDPRDLTGPDVERLLTPPPSAGDDAE